MSMTVQTLKNVQPENKKLIAFKSMLNYIGIHVTQPAKDESFFYGAQASAKWHRYDKKLGFYKSIAFSPFHIVYNDETIDNEMGLQILYAMLKERPIIMTSTPVLANDLNLFIRDIIRKHLPEFHSINLPEFELIELSLLLHKLKPTNYHLSKTEQVLINARVKTLFRDLVDNKSTVAS